MTPTPSTPYSRDLGDELRHLCEKHTDYTGTEIAETPATTITSYDQTVIPGMLQTENSRAGAQLTFSSNAWRAFTGLTAPRAG